MVICVGIAVYDIIFDFKNNIVTDKKNTASNMRMEIGGNGINVARVLNHYKVPVQLISPLSQDIFGKALKQMVLEEGINIASPKNDTDNNNTQTPISVILNNLNDSSRTILNYKKIAHLPKINFVDHCDIIYSDGRFPEYTKQCRQKFPDIPIIWDWERLIHFSDNKELLQSQDIVICSEDFFEEYKTHKNLSNFELSNTILQDIKINHFIVTKGKAGIVWFSKQGELSIPATKVNAIDTNGAGDVFHSLFIYYYLQTKNIKESLDISQQLVSKFVAKKGFIEALPKLI